MSCAVAKPAALCIPDCCGPLCLRLRKFLDAPEPALVKAAEVGGKEGGEERAKLRRAHRRRNAEEVCRAPNVGGGEAAGGRRRLAHRLEAGQRAVTACMIQAPSAEPSAPTPKAHSIGRSCESSDWPPEASGGGGASSPVATARGSTTVAHAS